MSETQPQPSRSRPPERGVLAIIRAIQAGELKPTSLDKREKRHVVEHLMGEGYSVPEIADVLKVSERTITRLRKRVRESNALEADPRRTAQMAGLIVQQAELAGARCRRIHADPKSDPSTRLDAARACWQVYRELIQILQALGLVDSARTGGTDTWDREVSPERLEAELQHIRAVAALPPGPSDVGSGCPTPSSSTSSNATPKDGKTENAIPFLTTTVPAPIAPKDTSPPPQGSWEITEKILYGPDVPITPPTPPPPRKPPGERRFDKPVQQPLPEAPLPPSPGDIPS